MLDLAKVFALPAAIALLGLGLAVWALAQAARDAAVMDRLKVFSAELARPFSIIATSGSVAFAMVAIALRSGPSDWGGAALVIAAGYTGLCGLYWGRAWENQKVQGHAAEVEKVRAAQASPPPAEALKPAAPEPERSLEDPA